MKQIVLFFPDKNCSKKSFGLYEPKCQPSRNFEEELEHEVLLDNTKILTFLLFLTVGLPKI